MLLAGGQGSRLYVLTSDVAKPAVPFGGKYRIIDFSPLQLHQRGDRHGGRADPIQASGLEQLYRQRQAAWDLDRMDGGVHILPPYMQEGEKGSWYKGTANAIYQNIGFVDMYDPDYVVILSGDHIYKMNYSKMVDAHKAAGAACTISVLEVPWDEASRFGIMAVDENDNIVEFQEKPKEPKSNLASMGIYVFTWKKLREYLIRDEADTSSSNDFGKNIIPNMLAAGEKMIAYRFDGVLEGRGHPGEPVGRQHGYALPGTIWTCWRTAGPSTPGSPPSPRPLSARTPWWKAQRPHPGLRGGRHGEELRAQPQRAH